MCSTLMTLVCADCSQLRRAKQAAPRSQSDEAQQSSYSLLPGSRDPLSICGEDDLTRQKYATAECRGNHDHAFRNEAVGFIDCLGGLELLTHYAAGPLAPKTLAKYCPSHACKPRLVVQREQIKSLYLSRPSLVLHVST